MFVSKRLPLNHTGKSYFFIFFSFKKVFFARLWLRNSNKFIFGNKYGSVATTPAWRCGGDQRAGPDQYGEAVTRMQQPPC